MIILYYCSQKKDRWIFVESFYIYLCFVACYYIFTQKTDSCDQQEPVLINKIISEKILPTL
nr:MAG TPA_asm: hypothetical protein [Caudoviricetes sp.]